MNLRRRVYAPDPEGIAVKLVQKALVRGSQSFELDRDGNLIVSSKGMGVERREAVALATLEPDCVRIRTHAYPLLVAAVVSGGFALIMLITLIFESARVGDPISPVILGLPSAVFAFFMFAKYIRRSVNIVAFYPRFGGGAAVTPWHNNPTAEEFDAFVRELSERIREASLPKAGEPFSLEAELRSLQRLRDDGLLTSEEFDVAKQRVLGLTQKPSIGFRRAS